MSSSKFAGRRGVGILLVLILALAAGLRFYGLGAESLWLDELWSLNKSSHDTLSDVIKKGAGTELWPPGFHVVLYGVQRWIGNSEWALRLPSALGGVLTVLAVFLLGKRLYTAREGLVAAALMAVLWCPIYYSQEARAYSPLLLFTLLSVYFWIPILKSLSEERWPRRRDTVGYILTALASASLHYFGLYFIVLQAAACVIFLVKRRKHLLRFLLIYGAIAVLYSPWLPFMLHQLKHSGQTISWVKHPGWKTPFRYLLFFFNHSHPLLLLVGALYAFWLFRELFGVWKRRGLKDVGNPLLCSGPLLVMWLVIPFAGACLVSFVWSPVCTARNLIIALPAAYLLLARSVTTLPVRPRFQALLAVAIVGVCLADLVFRLNYYSEPQKEQFREAVAYIVDHQGRYPDSLVVGWSREEDFFGYYFERQGCPRGVDLLAGRKEDVPAVAAEIARRRPRYVWYVWAHAPPEPEFLDFLEKNLTLLDCQRFIKVQVRLFENESRSVPPGDR